MKLQNICEQYAAFRKALGERFEVNGSQLKGLLQGPGARHRYRKCLARKGGRFSCWQRPAHNQLVREAQRLAWILSVCHQSRIYRNVSITARHPEIGADIPALYFFVC
jgi:hypothetical protein